MKLLVTLLALLAIAPPEHTLQTRYLMGTLYTIEAEGPGASKAVDAAFQALHHLDDTLSTYKPASELSQVNRAAGKGWTRVSLDTAAVVSRALGYARESAGAFDPTVEPLMLLWGFKDRNYRLPSSREIGATLGRVGFGAVGVAAAGPALRLARPGMALDLGAIAKGFAVDRAVTMLRSAGMTRIRVDAGGNQGVWNAHPESEWFGVKNPLDESQEAAAVSFANAGVSSSSDAERGFTRHGVRYGHLLDPRTGRPATGMLQVTVVAPTAEEADALSTTLYVLGERRGRELLRHHPGCSALFIEPDPKQPRLVATVGLTWRPATALLPNHP